MRGSARLITHCAEANRCGGPCCRSASDKEPFAHLQVQPCSMHATVAQTLQGCTRATFVPTVSMEARVADLEAQIMHRKSESVRLAVALRAALDEARASARTRDEVTSRVAVLERALQEERTSRNRAAEEAATLVASMRGEAASLRRQLEDERYAKAEATRKARVEDATRRLVAVFRSTERAAACAALRRWAYVASQSSALVTPRTLAAAAAVDSPRSIDAPSLGGGTGGGTAGGYAPLPSRAPSASVATVVALLRSRLAAATAAVADAEAREAAMRAERSALVAASEAASLKAERRAATAAAARAAADGMIAAARDDAERVTAAAHAAAAAAATEAAELVRQRDAALRERDAAHGEVNLLRAELAAAQSALLGLRAQLDAASATSHGAATSDATAASVSGVAQPLDPPTSPPFGAAQSPPRPPSPNASHGGCAAAATAILTDAAATTGAHDHGVPNTAAAALEASLHSRAEAAHVQLQTGAEAIGVNADVSARPYASGPSARTAAATTPPVAAAAAARGGDDDGATNAVMPAVILRTVERQSPSGLDSAVAASTHPPLAMVVDEGFGDDGRRVERTLFSVAGSDDSATSTGVASAVAAHSPHRDAASAGTPEGGIDSRPVQSSAVPPLPDGAALKADAVAILRVQLRTSSLADGATTQNGRNAPAFLEPPDDALLASAVAGGARASGSPRRQVEVAQSEEGASPVIVPGHEGQSEASARPGAAQSMQGGRGLAVSPSDAYALVGVAPPYDTAAPDDHHERRTANAYDSRTGAAVAENARAPALPVQPQPTPPQTPRAAQYGVPSALASVSSTDTAASAAAVRTPHARSSWRSVMAKSLGVAREEADDTATVYAAVVDAVDVDVTSEPTSPLGAIAALLAEPVHSVLRHASPVAPPGGAAAPPRASSDEDEDVAPSDDGAPHTPYADTYGDGAAGATSGLGTRVGGGSGSSSAAPQASVPRPHDTRAAPASAAPPPQKQQRGGGHGRRRGSTGAAPQAAGRRGTAASSGGGNTQRPSAQQTPSTSASRTTPSAVQPVAQAPSPVGTPKAVRWSGSITTVTASATPPPAAAPPHSADLRAPPQIATPRSSSVAARRAGAIAPLGPDDHAERVLRSLVRSVKVSASVMTEAGDDGGFGGALLPSSPRVPGAVAIMSTVAEGHNDDEEAASVAGGPASAGSGGASATSDDEVSSSSSQGAIRHGYRAALSRGRIDADDDDVDDEARGGAGAHVHAKRLQWASPLAAGMAPGSTSAH